MNDQTRLSILLESESHFKQLCDFLDLKHWKDFADEINTPAKEVSRIEEIARSNIKFSPSRELLEKWLPSEEATVGKLIEILTVIKHHDAVLKIQEWIKTETISPKKPILNGNDNNNNNNNNIHKTGNASRKRRILCLDGGGLRCIVLLDILDLLQKESKINFKEEFDLICGTSTGGYVAIGIGLLDRPIEEMKILNKSFNKVFSRGSWSLPGWYSWYFHSAYYDSELLDDQIREVLGKDCDQLMGSYGEKHPEKPKVFVAAANADFDIPTPFVCSSYTRSTKSAILGTDQMTLFEACRASSGTPGCFRPFVHKEGKFIDGGVVANNPIELAYFEARNLFPNDEIELILSVGTGLQIPHGTGFTSNILSTSYQVLNVATDSSSIHERFERYRPFLAGMENTEVIRLNPPHLGQFGFADTREEARQEFQAGVKRYWSEASTRPLIT